MLVFYNKDLLTKTMQHLFRKLSTTISTWAGTAGAFVIAFSVVAVWVITGPIFNFSNTWQLVINTGTTIVTFLMVFLIQNTQNRDSRAVQLKLDELIRATSAARDSFVDLEELNDSEIAKLNDEFRRMHEQSQTPLPGIKKLHTKVLAVHQKRQSSK